MGVCLAFGKAREEEDWGLGRVTNFFSFFLFFFTILQKINVYFYFEDHGSFNSNFFFIMKICKILEKLNSTTITITEIQ